MGLTQSDRERILAALHNFYAKVKSLHNTGQAREHAYRPAQIALFDEFPDVLTVNDAAKSQAGFPDFLFLKASNTEITRGYGEGKDLGVNLDQIEKTDQLLKYAAYDNLMLTNVLEYRFYVQGELRERLNIAQIGATGLEVDSGQFNRLVDEFDNFLEQPPEKIRSAKRLAHIMGGKARRIRSIAKLLVNGESANDVRDVYALVRETLSPEMEPNEFADMYAQTLVYGLFAARYHDTNLATFSRQEARDLIAQETDFLKHFFDHIAGASLPADLLHVVNELCDVLRVSDVHTIVSTHLGSQDRDGRDPVIYFYELFLSEYDAEQRKDRGVYYTPTPIVRYIVRAVDRALIQHLGIPEGLADAQKKTYTYEVDRGFSSSRRKKRDTPVPQDRKIHRVQILDPAVGTATFLNEVIRHIHKRFEQQAGLWSGYVKDDLLPRLHGFELMMAPYSIAHIKLAMTLGELGVSDPGKATGVYLTNTLDKPAQLDHDLFTIGLAAAFSQEASRASTIKTETPIMVVVANPPYSGHSENRSRHAKDLVQRYKVEPGGQTKLQERNSKWLNDDYVKFIAFSEQMIDKNADGGVMAMITNNGYLDNPTFRGMRWHLTQTFDFIYIIDLHGSLKKKEVAPDGSRDENVFAIQQGVAIIVAVKVPGAESGPAQVMHADLFGTRTHKFASLDADLVDFRPITLDPKFYFFVPRNDDGREDYQAGLPLDSIFKKSVIGLFTGRDKLTIDIDRDTLWQRVNAFISLSPDDARTAFELGGDVRDWKVESAQADVRDGHSEERLVPITYRPFDVRWTYYTGTQRGFYYYPRLDVMRDLRDDESNVALVVGRQGAATGRGEWTLAYVARHVIDLNIFARGGGYVFPLRVRTQDGDWTDNLSDQAIAVFGRILESTPPPERIFDYVYGVLNSVRYRTDAEEFLKSDYPIIPLPQNAPDFERHVEFGKRMRELHLLEASDLQGSTSLTTTYPVSGSNLIERRRYDAGAERLWINSEQYIGNVTPAMWEYRIGGYQVADKWLKDRRGTALSWSELRHIQVILTAISLSLSATTRFSEEESQLGP